MRIDSQLINMRLLDELATGQSPVHRLHPAAKLVATLAFVAVVASYPKYEVAGLLPLLFFPLSLAALGGLPAGALLKRLAVAMPFVLFIAIFNPVFDPRQATVLGGLTVTYGWLSFASIVLRCLLAVGAALILVATTGMDALGAALLRLRVPQAMVVQLMFMYRYIYILMEEFSRVLRAYNLRAFGSGGIRPGAWGSLLGHLLVRTLARAQRIYAAMLCRGFDGSVSFRTPRGFTASDAVFTAGWIFFFLASRNINLPQWLGSLLTGR